ncbi:hypothetical protein HAPAU_28010 [Halalkalicoccus paucihalophilus]|uniref:Uncharacterized protein n=2 Tax=Halalkalicoccus paucihalophilus TaxID=1008153 RepID=A0A151ACX4_9EURY|nr:hypothetical protein HAPAU_28010 [Halalkalicoccus paucihalophilus]
MDRRAMNRFVRTTLRKAGRHYEKARHDYEGARNSVLENERAHIVCRRYAEKRAVELDSDGRPECYEAGHPDCEGCVEDLHNETIETW